MQHAELLWQPSQERIQRSQMYAFMQDTAKRHGFSPDWPSLHEWSVTHRNPFWTEMLDFAEIRPTKRAGAVETGEGMLGTNWFPGMELNFAAHLLRFDDERVALEAEDELGRTRSITYRALRVEVARLAAAMRAAGIKRGDRVGGYMPNIPETVMAMLAATGIGAVQHGPAILETFRKQHGILVVR